MSTPKIDKRSREAVLAELESLAAANVNDLTGDSIEEWRNRKDPAYALLQIFSYMADHTITQLNKVPEKKLIAYLNLIGTKLLCAQPARTPVNFTLSQGALVGVTIPGGTQVSTSAKDGVPPVIFETERPITATTSQLKALISVDQTIDQVFDHLKEIDSTQKETGLFMSPPMQEHAIYFGHDSLFKFQKGVGAGYLHIELTVEPTGGSLNSNVKWAFSCGDSSEEQNDWIDFASADNTGTETVTLIKKNTMPTSKKTINGASTYWIRAKMDVLSDNIATVKSVKARIINEVRPDIALYNDVPIDFTTEFYPFGTQPNTSDVFYIASQEGFSKKDSTVTITFNPIQLGSSPNIDRLLLSWEYWDGKNWANLKDDSLEAAKKGFVSPISFVCPNIIPTKVNGKENYWIRVRIVSGNYGVNIPPVTVKQEGNDPTTVTTSGLEGTPPKFGDIKIENRYVDPIDLQYATTKNNLQFNKFTNQTKPFVPLEESNQTLYLGFDKPLGEGIISVFFALRKQEYQEDKKPRIVWSYLRTAPKSEWVPIQVDDSTDNLTQSGAVGFLAPNDMGIGQKFGSSLYWLRGEVVENKFQSIGQTIVDAVGKADSEATDSLDAEPKMKTFQVATEKLKIHKTLLMYAEKYYPAGKLTTAIRQSEAAMGQPCNIMDIYHPKFSVQNIIKDTPAAPITYAVSLNTTWAVQAETVTDELLGTSDGTANKPFSLTRAPIVSENVSVKEPLVPSDQDLTVTITATGEIWVKWQAVEDFLDSKENSRHYTLDRVNGEIKFGNGLNGMIPPVGAAIKATYQTGGGVKGNVGAGEVKNLVTAIAFVDKAVNIDDAQGGADTETTERAEERGPKAIQHRHRAVAKEDYEWLAVEASGDVARAKCIPHLNSEGKQESGCVAVIIIPASREDKPMPSSRLLQIVEDYLKSHCPLSLSSLVVTAPTYLGVSVNVDIYVTSIDTASKIRFSAMDKIKSFLHPLYGGPEGKGWDFGQVPCNSDVLAILQKIPDVDHIENLKITVSEGQSDVLFTVNGYKILPGYTLIFSGTHNVNVEPTGDA